MKSEKQRTSTRAVYIPNGGVVPAGFGQVLRRYRVDAAFSALGPRDTGQVSRAVILAAQLLVAKAPTAALELYCRANEPGSAA